MMSVDQPHEVVDELIGQQMVLVSVSDVDKLELFEVDLWMVKFLLFLYGVLFHCVLDVF